MFVIWFSSGLLLTMKVTSDFENYIIDRGKKSYLHINHI